jgi:hypothetical protein
MASIFIFLKIIFSSIVIAVFNCAFNNDFSGNCCKVLRIDGVAFISFETRDLAGTRND